MCNETKNMCFFKNVFLVIDECKMELEFQSRQIRKKQETLMAKIKEATVKIPKAPEQKVIKSYYASSNSY